MLNILEELNMMYEVKNDAENAYAGRRTSDKVSSQMGHKGIKHGTKLSNKSEHDPYRTSYSNKPMRTADDYRTRRGYADASKFGRDYLDSKAKNECTETIDTLDMILA